MRQKVNMNHLLQISVYNIEIKNYPVTVIIIITSPKVLEPKLAIYSLHIFSQADPIYFVNFSKNMQYQSTLIVRSRNYILI